MTKLEDNEGALFMSSNLRRLVFSKEEHIIKEVNMVVDFRLEDSHIYTKRGKLVIESISEVEKIDSVLEIRRYIRPRILVIQGILTFFSGICFTVYQGVSSDSHLINSKEGVLKEITKNKLVIDGVNYSTDLNILLSKLENHEEKPMIITLLDRWRKAIYMIEESEVNTYHDEAILTHFHILELLVGDYYEQYKKEATKEIRDFIEKFSYNMMGKRGNNLAQTINNKSKLLNEILINEEASITTKINYFLKQFNLLDDQTYSYVSKLVKIRNAIAHGRVIYRDNLIWPLPPFFNLTLDSNHMVNIISIFSAKAISLHIGLDVWKKEWEEAHINLPPSDEVINDFLKDGEQHLKVVPEELITGKYNAITVVSIVDYYMNNKKCRVSDLENALGKVIENVQISKDNTEQLFLISIILADSENGNVAKISRGNVELIHKNDWYPYSNIKDILTYFEYCNKKVVWFEEWLNDRGHNKHRNVFGSSKSNSKIKRTLKKRFVKFLGSFKNDKYTKGY